MFKTWFWPFVVFSGLAVAFLYVFRDQVPALSAWVAGGRNTSTINGTLPAE